MSRSLLGLSVISISGAAFEGIGCNNATDLAGSTTIPHVKNGIFIGTKLCACAGFYEVLKLTGLQVR